MLAFHTRAVEIAEIAEKNARVKHEAAVHAFEKGSLDPAMARRLLDERAAAECAWNAAKNSLAHVRISSQEAEAAAPVLVALRGDAAVLSAGYRVGVAKRAAEVRKLQAQIKRILAQDSEALQKARDAHGKARDVAVAHKLPTPAEVAPHREHFAAAMLYADAIENPNTVWSNVVGTLRNMLDVTLMPTVTPERTYADVARQLIDGTHETVQKQIDEDRDAKYAASRTDYLAREAAYLAAQETFRLEGSAVNGAAVNAARAAL